MPPLSGQADEPAAAVAAALGPAVVQLRTSEGLGSGFVYDRSGLIMTAAHVTDGASSVQVRLADGAHLIASVPSDGLAGLAVGSDAHLVWPRSAALPVATTNTSEGEEQK